MQASVVQTNQKNYSSAIFQRIGQSDKTASEYIDNYGDLIWAMAKTFTDSNEEAEAAAKEIFLNIWHYAARFEQIDFDELIFITIFARRQLRKHLENANQ